jgi:hypothetical protein
MTGLRPRRPRRRGPVRCYAGALEDWARVLGPSDRLAARIVAPLRGRPFRSSHASLSRPAVRLPPREQPRLGRDPGAGLHPLTECCSCHSVSFLCACAVRPDPHPQAYQRPPGGASRRWRSSASRGIECGVLVEHPVHRHLRRGQPAVVHSDPDGQAGCSRLVRICGRSSRSTRSSDVNGSSRRPRSPSSPCRWISTGNRSAPRLGRRHQMRSATGSCGRRKFEPAHSVRLDRPVTGMLGATKGDGAAMCSIVLGIWRCR